jgi:hypothetical protein
MKAYLANIVEGRAREFIRLHGSEALKVARHEAHMTRGKGDQRAARRSALIAARIREISQEMPRP